jgi:hypothetical protein
MSKQKPTLTGKQALDYELSIEAIIDRASGSNAPGHNPAPPAMPKEHLAQVQEWRETRAYPGRFEEPRLYDDGAFPCDVCGEWTHTGECRCVRGA